MSVNQPISVFLFITKFCNFSCRHCYVSTDAKQKEHMTLANLKLITDRLLASGITDLRLTGGEPTYHPKFIEIIDHLASKQIEPRLITNGSRLMKLRSVQTIMDKLSQCWVSVYGISDEQHRKVAGTAALPLEEVLEFAGAQSKKGYWVGVSVLLTHVSREALVAFMAHVHRVGVKRIRFLFSEPTGRAASTQVTYRADNGVVGANNIADLLSKLNSDRRFDFLSIGNPFVLGSLDKVGLESCMLANRKMWSISPSGDLYSCCYNIYQPDHYVTNILSGDGGLLNIKDIDLFGTYAPRCNALKNNYWKSNVKTGNCPISALDLTI